nr:hypothetical protein [Tanacetum cinerariifolium]
MVVRNQSQLGEGSAIPTNPHHTPTIIQPSTQPQKKQQPRKPKRKDTQVPQPSDPIENVPNEAVHKDLDNSLVRAAITASSLEEEQDSGGGPWCQETIGVLLLKLGLRLYLNIPMIHCSQETMTTQHNEIASLTRRVKKLEKKNRSRTHRLKRLYKVGLTGRVESSGNKESFGKDASKQGRIDAIDADKEITLVSVQDEVISNDADKEMFDMDGLDGEKVFVAEHEVSVKGVNNKVNVAEEVVKVINTFKLIIDAAQVSAASDKVSAASAATNEKEIDIQELGKPTPTKFSQQSHDKGKGILIEPVKPMKRKDQTRFNEEAALKLQAAFDEEERLAREKAEKVVEEANIALIETWDDLQAKIDADHQLAKRMQAQE